MRLFGSRTFRVWFVGLLISASLGITLLTGWLFRPRRDETIRYAVKHSSGPGFWWPPSWRAEYRAVTLFSNHIRQRHFDLALEQIDAAKIFDGGRNAFWTIVQVFRDQDLLDPATLHLLSRCRFDYRGWDPEIDEFLAVLCQMQDDNHYYPERVISHHLIRMASGSKRAIPPLVKGLGKAFDRKLDMDRAKWYEGPDQSQPVIDIAVALGKIGPDASEAVPILLKILRYEESHINAMPRDSVMLEMNCRVHDTVMQSLQQIDPAVALEAKAN